LEHSELMAQDQDLDLVGGVVSERAWSIIQLSSLANIW